MVKGKKPQVAKKPEKPVAEKKPEAPAASKKTAKQSDFASLLDGLDSVRGMPQIVKPKDKTLATRAAQAAPPSGRPDPAASNAQDVKANPALAPASPAGPAREVITPRDISSLMDSAPWAKKGAARHVRPAPAVKEHPAPPAMWPELSGLNAPDKEAPVAAQDSPPPPLASSGASAAPPRAPAPPQAENPAGQSWQALLEGYCSKPSPSALRPPEAADEEPVAERRLVDINDLISHKLAAEEAPAEPPSEPVDADGKEETLKTPSPPAQPAAVIPPAIPPADEKPPALEAKDPPPFDEATIAAPAPAEAKAIVEEPAPAILPAGAPPASLAALLAVSKQAEQSAASPPPKPALTAAAKTAARLPASSGATPAKKPAAKPVPPARPASGRDIPVEDLLGGIFSLITSGFRGASPAIKKIQENSASGMSSVGKGVRQLADKILVSQKGKS
jgi:hypothetical protein